MPDLAAAYADTRASMISLVEDLDPDALRRPVPACPAWTVQDLIAHVASIAASISDETFPPDLNPALFWDEATATRRDAFVDAALEQRRDHPIADLLQEWRSASERLEAMMRGDEPWPASHPPLPAWIVTTDLAVHHHDLRGALEAPGERDSLATGLALRSYVEGMRFRAIAEGSPAFRIVAGSRSWDIGQGEPVATLTADPFELARAASGRRNPEQIRAYDWEGDPEPFIGFFFPYGVRQDALVE